MDQIGPWTEQWTGVDHESGLEGPKYRTISSQWTGVDHGLKWNMVWSEP